MDPDSFATGLVTGLRQAVEPALIVSLILAYLAKTGNARHRGKIWIGTGLALGMSVVAGTLLWITLGDFEGSGEDLFEAIAMLAGAAVITSMLFWMRSTAADIESGAEPRADSVLVEGSIFGLAILAFTEVIGEGVETAVFLIDQATAAGQDAGALGLLSGAVIGISLALLTGLAVFRGARIVDRRTFFVWAGVALIFIAAGLVSHAVREFILIGWITVGLETAFDISAVLPHEATDANGLAGAIGYILRGIFGYTSRPEWITFLTWLCYLLAVLTLYMRPPTSAPSEARPMDPRVRYGSRPSSQDVARAA